jgi:hypothetical protein
MRYLLQLLTLASVLLLASCGGGDGCAGAPIGSPPNGCGAAASTTGVAAIASFVFTLDKSSISNAGGDKALLTVTALDASRNVIVGATVFVSVSSGIYVPLVTKTDATGSISGNVQIGGDKSNRNIVVTFGDGVAVSGTATVAVTGANVAITPLPSTPALGASVQANIKATDANGAGIAFANIQLGGTLGFTQLITTDASGNASATITAPGTAGTYSITATGLGVTGISTVQVIGGGGGAIPDVPPATVVSAASLAINPNLIAPNPTGSVTNRAALKAVFLDALNAPIPNMRVRFDIVPPGLGVGEQISTSTTTVYSDPSGTATADYIAGARTSPTNGVVIKACYGKTDADTAGTTCTNFVTKTLTVASQPISITLGSNNFLESINGNLQYRQKFVVAVNDAGGLAIPGAIISATVDITHYAKGYYYADPYYVEKLPGPAQLQLVTAPDITISDTATATIPYIRPSDIPVAPILSTTPPTFGKRFWCLNEDKSRNGFLDTGEDINGNGKLEPRKADIVLSYVNGNTTAADGTALIQVTYLQNVATWESFTVKVSTAVGGTEGLVEQSFLTSFIKGDELNGSFLTPPYGVNNCQTPN